jgi:hypothetical protein
LLGGHCLLHVGLTLLYVPVGECWNLRGRWTRVERPAISVASPSYPAESCLDSLITIVWRKVGRQR